MPHLRWNLLRLDVFVRKFCGYAVPPSQVSTGNMMYVTMITDGSLQFPGFSATYSASMTVFRWFPS